MERIQFRDDYCRDPLDIFWSQQHRALLRSGCVANLGLTRNDRFDLLVEMKIGRNSLESYSCCRPGLWSFSLNKAQGLEHCFLYHTAASWLPKRLVRVCVYAYTQRA
jgi:hypothetical protein